MFFDDDEFEEIDAVLEKQELEVAPCEKTNGIRKETSSSTSTISASCGDPQEATKAVDGVNGVNGDRCHDLKGANGVDCITSVNGAHGRSGADATSEQYFDRAARKNMHWYCEDTKTWLRQSDAGDWRGWQVENAASATRPGAEWTPWHRLLDDDDPPFYMWYEGARTNAAFSEVDVHVLDGRGDEVAYVEEPDTAMEGAVQAPRELTRSQLLFQSMVAAQVMAHDYGLIAGDRVLMFLPPSVEQIIWVEACKRLGIIYCCCNPRLPAEQIADRVVLLKPKLLITIEHPEWSCIAHKALNNYMPCADAIQRAASLGLAVEAELAGRWRDRVTVSCLEPPFAEGGSSAAPDGPLLSGTSVLILGYLAAPISAVQRKMMNARPVPVLAETRVLGEDWARDELSDEAAGRLQGPADVAAMYKRYPPPVPLEANFPMFVIFTSGTTGKPKGVCHTHAYIAGLVETMKVSFQAKQGVDRMMTVATLGWITGQSYQISAVLASGVTSVLMQGHPTSPSPARFAHVINKHNVTIFKAGSAFLRGVMTTDAAMKQVEETDTTCLKVATFCAEPVSGAVQEWAQGALCANYINSYWATEHGGIVWSREFGNSEQVLKADAHCWPMRWLDADVYAFEDQNLSDAGGAWKAQRAGDGVRADVVCTSPFPYMLRYVWGDVENFGAPGWRGDRRTMTTKYWRRVQTMERATHWVYTQGDFAVRHQDGSYTFHGRSDEVLNVNGILFGTEHLEGGILRDKQLGKSPIGHCVVTGIPHAISGEVPLAWITPADPGDPPTETRDFGRLFRLVQDTVGSVNLMIIVVKELPQTFSGKFMRRVLMAISRGEALPDLSMVSNPDCIPHLIDSFSKWNLNR